MRIGIGYDVHKFKKGRDLIIGGVKIPFDLGLDGHSDADVLVHSIMDALLGSLALGDIGLHFPDSDSEYKNIDSILLLKKVKELIEEKDYDISNIDSVVIAQKPKLIDYIEEMRLVISKTLAISIDKVSIKATTEEGLGFTGEIKGIKAEAVVLLERKKNEII